MRKIKIVCGLFTLLAAPWICNGSVVSSGTTEIPGTWLFDFDAGVQTSDPSAADVWWDLQNSTMRWIAPYGGGTVVNIGAVDFNTLTVADLEALTYGTADIDGSDGTSVLVTGDVFAVHTGLGNYAKVLVTGPLDPGEDDGLPIQWETDSVPEPDGLAGLATGAFAMAAMGRRVRRTPTAPLTSR
jgi:hypothetical protein